MGCVQSDNKIFEANAIAALIKEKHSPIRVRAELFVPRLKCVVAMVVHW